MDKLNALLDAITGVLSGEPARVIGYGGAVIIYLVAKAIGAIPDQSFDQAIAEAVAALAIVASFVESIRHFVYSPNTVKAIVEDASTGPDLT